jgi:hypothetical protein
MTVSILIPSCDNYSDLWPVFFHYFFKNWPDCPYPIFLGSNYKEYDDSRVESILIGDDISWCSNLLHYLEYIKSQYILMFLDDFLVTEKIETQEINHMIEVIQNHSISCLRLKPSPPPSRRCKEIEGVGVVLPGEPYRISTQVAIWDKRYLREVARPDYNIWQFELYGSYRSDRLPGTICCVEKPLISYKHCVERGEWFPESYEICFQDQVISESTTRGIMDKTKLKKKQKKNLFDHIISFCPRWLRRKIRLYRYKNKFQDLI